MIAAALAALASLPAAAGLTEDLKQKLEGAVSGDMTFSQTVIDPAGKAIESKGRLAYLRPARFALEYEKPDPVNVVSDGSHLWVHDIGLNQVVVSRLEVTTGGQGFMAVLTKDDLASSFDLDSRSEGSIDWLLLMPHDEDEVGFESCEIGFDNKGVIIAVRLVDLVGNKVDARFKYVGQGHPGVERFSFTPPDDAEVVHQPN